MVMPSGFESANTAFYQAFARADFDAMRRLWAAKLPVLCLHPGAAPLLSRIDILDSWRQIFIHGHPREISFVPQQMSLVAGIGIACWPGDAEDADMLLSRSEIAMYAAKRNGRNRVEVEAPPMTP